MNRTGKTIITLLGIATIGLGGSAYAQFDDAKLSQLDQSELRELRQLGDRDAFREKLKSMGIDRPTRPQLNNEQKEIIKELKEDGDREAIKNQLDEWGIQAPHKENKGLRAQGVFTDLNEDQKEELQELRQNGDREAVREKLEEFGVELPTRPELTIEQKEIIAGLRKDGDREAIHEYFEKIGLKKPRKHFTKRAQIIDSLNDNEREVLQEAHDIARAGDKETARALIIEIFAGDAEDEGTPKGFFGFFKRMLN